MRSYWPAAVIALAGVGMLAGAAVIAHHEPDPVAEIDGGRGGSVWGANYFPNVPLINHQGETVRFFDDLIRDKVVLINFIYTSCPDTCPMETARMLEVARILGDRLGDDVFFYSITIDPQNDTPEALGEFAANWGIPEGWWFLTGKPDDLITVRGKLGVSIEDVETLNFSAHPIHLVMGNQATGRWMKRSPFENPYVLADQVGRWLHDWKAPPAEKRDYADAPEIRQISTGETLFRDRCAACHTIGRGDVEALAERRIGPDLLDVGRHRDREWLERWLKEPDVMIEEGDPLATALLAKYKSIPMPNLRLGDADVDKLLGYIDRESRRIGDLRDAGAPGGHEGRGGHHGEHGVAGGHAAHGEHAASAAL